MPPPPTAVARCWSCTRQDQPTDGGTLIRTDVALMGTTRIAASPAARVLRASRRTSCEDYQGIGLTNNLLELMRRGTTTPKRVAGAQALAKVFIADHVRRIQAAADAEAKALLDQRDQMQTELDQVNGRSGTSAHPGEAERPRRPRNLESLFARRAELTSLITDFDPARRRGRTSAPRLIAGTQIVDAPRAAAALPAQTAATNAGSVSSSVSSSGSRSPRSARWWRTAPCCAGRSRRTWAPRSSWSCAACPAGRSSCGSADGPAQHGQGSPRPWPAPCAAPRNRCRCWNWAVRAPRV